ncbi:DUF3717 domain-containing protein [Paraburkholderia rhynchosiae]|uniref:DUF3717 domain-containing protein n=1 Tax=Paraburkholderia rhynchosiae TaxID=487049 RepID=A0A2N7W7W5_9BURK|nr:DUF3717 domain-containing protein [Paraburkholderia rhynchosiae]PMS25481.1 hypothetical protein C0Z16_29170 [Paraburkholderia rhynchosiae]CAB3734123.1 hypothetical protein LMG27174_06086 [Paraburkholderia rhynchosiae]
MTTILTIADIEQAINYWCTRQAPGEDGALCKSARPLADLYGLMIYQRLSYIDVSRLEPEQTDAIRVAAAGGDDRPFRRRLPGVEGQERPPYPAMDQHGE